MRWRKFILLAVAVFLAPTASAQFVDSFVDGDFLATPEWQGDQGFFSVVNGRLKLQAPAVSGTAQLSTASKALHEASWEFSVQMDFTPSSSNYAKVYLAADQPDLRLPVNGYFVKVGNTSREVSLYRQTGTGEVEIIDGLDDRVNQPVVNVRIKVTRDAEGNWELLTETGTAWQSEGAIPDVIHRRSDWFGVQCVFTSTRSDKFWFDDFLVNGSEIPDLQPPVIVRVDATEPTEFEIRFSEPIDPSGLQFDNVRVIEIGNVVFLALTNNDSVLNCRLPSPMKNGVTYEMEVSDLSDLSGNSMPTTMEYVRYFRPGESSPKSVLITEVLPDPSPQIGLPAVEFAELYNAGQDPFDLKNWRLTDGSSTGMFPEYILLPGEYVIVTSAAGTGLFGTSPVVVLVNFPSLNNAGDKLVLMSNTGLGIDSVNYTLAWFRDEDKANGGWSLELIDPGNPCGEADNWAASDDERGGTPGGRNSIFANKPDLTPPSVLSVRTLDDKHVAIEFSELLGTSLQEATAEGFETISVHGMSLDESRKKVELTLAESLQWRTSYRLILGGIRDCNGNPMEPSEIRFGLPENADSLDIMVSEVLFNPRPGGVDFVEIHNTSEKFIDVEGWTLSNGEGHIPLPAIQLEPGAWLALTSDPETVRQQYPGAWSGNLATVDIPALSDEAGLVGLFSKSGMPMDQLSYSETWHITFLKSNEGVSLERISFSVPTQASENWISASSVTGFASPGVPNSCGRTGQQSQARVVVVPEIFSPGTGFVQIHYLFDQPGSVTNMVIYDQQGVTVKVLASNITLGSEGFLRWDGDRDNGFRAPAGYYILWMECFNSSGRVETIRKRIVIASP